MINLNETNYINLSYDKVTPEYRRQICRQVNYYDNYTEFYMFLFKHDGTDYHGIDSYTSNQRLNPYQLHYLKGRIEMCNNNIGGM